MRTKTRPKGGPSSGLSCGLDAAHRRKHRTPEFSPDLISRKWGNCRPATKNPALRGTKGGAIQGTFPAERSGTALSESYHRIRRRPRCGPAWGCFCVVPHRSSLPCTRRAAYRCRAAQESDSRRYYRAPNLTASRRTVCSKRLTRSIPLTRWLRSVPSDQFDHSSVPQGLPTNHGRFYRLLSANIQRTPSSFPSGFGPDFQLKHRDQR